MSRTFTIASSCINVEGGRYKSATPVSAAKKAASKLFKKAKDSSKYKSIRRITFSIRETTSGSDKNVYEYKANRVKLDKPVVRVINGSEIVNHYKIEIVSNSNKQNLKCKKIQRAESMASMNSMGGAKTAKKSGKAAKKGGKTAKKATKKTGKKMRYWGGEGDNDGGAIADAVENAGGPYDSVGDSVAMAGVEDPSALSVTSTDA
jgi:hypothetical protein